MVTFKMYQRWETKVNRYPVLIAYEQIVLRRQRGGPYGTAALSFVQLYYLFTTVYILYIKL
jgi:hypothetical protein